MNAAEADAFLAAARRAAPGWAAQKLGARLAVIHRARLALVRAAEPLAASIARPPAETIAAEILPLAAAAHFLEHAAPHVLRRRRPRRGTPPWLFGVRQEIHREPHGAVLILGPGNYPLFLPGAQALQALAAGNAVCVKPAPGAAAPMRILAELLAAAGLPDHVLQLLPEQAGPAAVQAGFDHIVVTGGVATGRAVARAAAETLTPTTTELSGVDPVFVLPGADLALTAACLAYGLRLNGGATCIAPRRVFVPRDMEAELLSRLLGQLPPPPPVPPATAARLATLLADAETQGAKLAARNPAILADATPSMALLRQDVFAPWLALVAVPDIEAALPAAAECPYALGASVFGPPAEAAAFARRVNAGSVCVNDLIVPTADPRLPFGGRGASGWGVTRGAEGLLAMTRTKTISIRRFGPRPHLDPRLAGDAVALLRLLGLLYGAWPDRLRLAQAWTKERARRG